MISHRRPIHGLPLLYEFSDAGFETLTMLFRVSESQVPPLKNGNV